VNEIITTEQQQLSLGLPGTWTPTGWIAPGGLSFENWEAIGPMLHAMEGAVHWWIGDWLNHGERKWGETYAQAMDEMEFEYGTLRNDAWVSSQIELSRRRDNLSWSHHQEVAQLKNPDEQDDWLRQAEENAWSRNELRRRIKQYKHDRLPTMVAQAAGPLLFVGHAEDMHFLDSGSVDLIITSPPYNLGTGSWPMGGSGRTPRVDGIGYGDEIAESEYQGWQVKCLIEMYRVARAGASLFYNHKVRNRQGAIIHPMDWLRNERNPWIIRQEIVWDRGSTHNHNAALFWPEDERIYWLTKGQPVLPARPIGMPSVWRFHGPIVDTWHPAPFSEELPRRCIEALGRDGITVLDPFAGSCTTLKVALEYGYDTIGVDVCADYLDKARLENGWTNANAN